LGAGLGLCDVGVENDPDVVFVEQFEADTLEEIAQRWDHVSNAGGKVLALSKDIPPGSPGERSLRMTATRGENTGGHLSRVIGPGYDKLYLRTSESRFARRRLFPAAFQGRLGAVAAAIAGFDRRQTKTGFRTGLTGED
jgi:hypothetical protein